MTFALRLAILMSLTLGIGVSRQPSSIIGLAAAHLATIDGAIALPGLRADVRVIRDNWGVPHIYAQSAYDLFFAQGFVIAQDRLWQMEMWRRAADGRLAEILGPSAVERDRLARLLKYRGPADDRELTTYHPDAGRLMTAYVAGVNAFISSQHAKLPIEFVVTGIRPEPWTIETLLLRQITFGDGAAELQLARSVAEVGVAEANRRRNPDPWEELIVPDRIDVSAIAESYAALTDPMRATTGAIRPELLPQYQSMLSSRHHHVDNASIAERGSNNWVLSGTLSETGKPVVANDPHRDVGLPSLRYIVHLNAPGWNVIGATEPPFFGVALGHNDRVAWGLTIVGTDQHDVYVEEMNPANPDEVRWRDGWERVRSVTEQIRVRGQAPQRIDLKFTRHGPIFYVDAKRRLAYSLRSALHAPGTAPYLGGLRLASTANCREFLDAAMHWYAPSENLICGDVDGNIAWQASALTPRRKGWTGRLPVSGTGIYEWEGFRADLPREINPARGFIATANHNVQPKGYSPPFMFKTADTRFDRVTRLLQLIQPGRRYSIDDHQRMQNDAYSLRAASDRKLFAGWTSRDNLVERARKMLSEWDAVYTRASTEAAIYETWRRLADAGQRGRGQDRRAPTPASLDAQLRQSIDALTKTQGADWRQWRWGRMHTRAFPHPFVSAFDLDAVERPGGAGTVAADGASYREILDVAEWDRSLATNVPGQSGQPGSPFYGSLLPLWADNRYFPLAFSRKAVDAHAAHTLVLRPR